MKRLRCCKMNIDFSGRPWPKLRLTETGLESIEWTLEDSAMLEPNPFTNQSIWYAIQVVWTALRPTVPMNGWTTELVIPVEGNIIAKLIVPAKDVPLIHALATLINAEGQE